tara:strand:+ start:2848 stop:3246 length:399 start_codon:yes stop_codon:yes gene_type:complete
MTATSFPTAGPANVNALSASGAGGGLAEFEYTITFGAVGAATLVTNRPDIVTAVSRDGLGDYSVTYSSAPMVWRMVRVDAMGAGTWRAVADVPIDGATEFFRTVDAADALVNPGDGDRVHVTVRYRVDGGSF